ncbi:hypothetical protein SASPL_101010 [Salvia splendens]|uniref:Dipeptidyl-peptidase II n=1 Tax=Salvia splendens TaxID=180675 RepID=A0A8X8YTR6_SALSN|nr:lysosomal Pro-X carboxypeptidase-like [Salvia splendens]KAG6436126.1 hypothetical protein SASPL_101010 [Salvia splendens]
MKAFTRVLIQYYLLFVLVLLQNVSTISPHKIPRLSPYNTEALSSVSAKNSEDLKTYYYRQTLDHFNFAPQSFATFNQRYVVSTKYWGGPHTNSPIFAFFGAEEQLDLDLSGIHFLSDIAPRFKSMSLYIEHRYYGESIPFGTMEEAMKNETTRGYFNSAQAIADYAEIVLHVKKKYSARNSPVIVVGGSYGGMLASWFRLKYPHIAVGALASSAPILYFENITSPDAYFSLVSKDFKEVSHKCYETIRKSWSEIDRIASKEGGLSILSRRFKTCSSLKSKLELKYYLEGMYSEAAQYNAPPKYPVTEVCRGIDGAQKGSDVIGRIFAGMASFRGKRSCYNMTTRNTQTSVGWRWQTCSELVIPIGIANDTMFEADPYDLADYIKGCKQMFGVSPRPHLVTTYYGGHDIKLVLKRFGSNIIFSNGLRDPYSTGGVLEDLSESILAVTTRNGSHCLDIVGGKESDPEWLVTQRKTEVKIMEGWLTKYYADLKA